MQLFRARVGFIMQRKWRVSLIVCVGVFMSSLDLFIVNIAFPSIAKHFGGASLASLSWILSGYAIVFAALLVPAGRWADAFGRKRAFLLGLAIFVAASAACALAPSVGFLVGARIVQAVGGALMLPTSLGSDAARVRAPGAPPGDRGLGRDGRHRGGQRAAAGRPAGPGGLAPGVPGERPGRPGRPAVRHPHPPRAPRDRARTAGPAGRPRADHRRRLACRRDRQGSGLGLGIPGRARSAGDDGHPAPGDLVALGTPPGADHRALDAAGALASGWRSAARCCSSRGSARCCSPASCS